MALGLSPEGDKRKVENQDPELDLAELRASDNPAIKRTLVVRGARQRELMNQTGIGFAGVDGVWWLPSLEPFALPTSVEIELAEFGKALFIFLDVITDLFRRGADETLSRWLLYKVPKRVSCRVARERVLSIRPDFQLFPLPDGSYRPIITELEICPSAHGFAHAMQAGYGLRKDLVACFASMLAGRPLLVVGTGQWSEFIFEQLAFCRALIDVGARGYVLYDTPFEEIAESVARQERWQPPIFGIHQKPANWNSDVLGRIRKHGFERCLWPASVSWPEEIGDAVVFRFGYVDNFTSESLDYFKRWADSGATFCNPASFFLDSKVVMAAARLTAVRQAVATIERGALEILDRCIPETILMESDCLERLIDGKDAWVLKYAGFDGGNQAWGGRSLQVGAYCDSSAWEKMVRHSVELPWPVVAQRVVPTVQVDIAYLDRTDELRWLRSGHTRLRSFVVRNENDACVCGSHVTVSGDGMQVSESNSAVQAPVVFV